MIINVFFVDRGDLGIASITLYSKNSNKQFKSLTRYGTIADGVNDKIIDKLTFNYDGTGNQLKYITDAGPNVALATSADFKDYSKVTTAEYAFNQNGAMTKDLNKGIVSKSGTSQLDGISYNVLNLPCEMVINNTEVKAKNYYTYTATGTKLKVIYRYDPNGLMMPLLGTTPEKDGLKPKSMTDYVGNKIYEDGVLKMTLTDNGYYDNIKNTYYFYIKDHLGNNRIVANASGISEQSTQYYPFGMAFGDGNKTQLDKQPYKYNGKELDRTHDLNWYDYSARQLDNAYGRFTSVDPLAEKYYSWSPYVYCMNNPVKLVDKDGKRPDFPPGAFGSPESIKASAVQQKVEPMMVEAARPAAISINIGPSLAGGIVALGGSQSTTVLLKGQDEGTGNIYNKTNLGVGTPGGDFSIGLDFTFLQGDSFLFNAQSMEGDSKDQTVTVGGGVVVSFTKSTATTPEGATLKSYGIKIGLGTRGVGYSDTKGNSTQVAGAKATEEKKQQQDKYKQQQAEKQKQQNSKTLLDSFWNWMTNN